MATEVSTLTSAEVPRTINTDPTRPQVAIMTSATSDLDITRTSYHVRLRNHDFAHELDGSLLSRNNTRRSIPSLAVDDVAPELDGSMSPKFDIRKGIPSLPDIWTKRLSAQKRRRQSRAKSGTSSELQLKVAPSGDTNGAVGGKTLQKSPKLISEEMKVQVPLLVRERLKTWNLSSSLHLTADENAKHEHADWEKLKQFIQFLDQNCSALFHGLPSRNLCLTLVAISPASATEPTSPLPYICVKGLMRETEITSFHTVLSQRSVRARYKPLRLCYDKSLVETASSDTIYQTTTSETPDTLCGALLHTVRSERGDWMSTIGGIIEVDGKFFAVTSSHHPSKTNSISDEGILDSESRSQGSSVVDTLVEEGSFDADIEPALILDAWKEQERQDHVVDSPAAAPVLLTKPPQSTNPFFWPDLVTSITVEGDDWCLLGVDEKHQLPNFIPFQQSSEGSVQREQSLLPAQPRGRRYLEAYPTELSKRAVYILAGISGICPGLLSSNISFLRIRGEGSRIVWSVKLDTGFELRKGDSGSWVIDAANNNILGYVVAISKGSVYLIPLMDLFEQITRVLKPEKPICIPSPFKMLISLARHYSNIDSDLSEQYALGALSPEVLNMQSSDPSILLAQYALNHGEDKHLLMRVLCSTGADLCSVLGSYSAWMAKHHQEIDEDKIRVLERLKIFMEYRNRPLRSEPELEINFASNTQTAGTETETTLKEKPTPSRQLHLKPFQWTFIFYFPVCLGYGVAGGVAAAATFAHMEELPYSGKILGNGALGGLVITAIFLVQFTIAILAYRLIYRSRAMSTGLIYSLVILLQLGLTFARTLLTALTLISRYHVENTRPIFIGATVGALPLVLDAVFLHSPSFLGFLLFIPGFDALAGFTFAIVCHENSYVFSRYASAAAAAAVYGSVNLILAICIQSDIYSKETMLRTTTPSV